MRKVYSFLLILYCSICIHGLAQTTILSENFNGSDPPAGWSKFNNSTGGTPALAAWTLRPDGYTYLSVFVDPPAVFHSNDNSQFYLTNSDEQEGDITETILQTPVFNTTGFNVVTLEFYHHFREFESDTAYIEVSTNGSDWNTILKLFADDEDSIGAAAAFAQQIVNLNAYGNNSNVHVRFRYYAEFGYYWALDNVLITGLSAPLPVTLLNFSGYRQNNHNVLKWTTLSEQNNRGFQLERSLDGIHYTAIGFINSLSPGGFSNSTLTYSFTDINPAGDKQYYRLRQVDLDGREKLSNIIIIKSKVPAVLTMEGLFPNPSANGINVLINAPKHDDIILQVIGLNGKIIKQKNAVIERGSNTMSFDVSTLTNGTYLLRVVSKTGGEMLISKFVKQ